MFGIFESESNNRQKNKNVIGKPLETAADKIEEKREEAKNKLLREKVEGLEKQLDKIRRQGILFKASDNIDIVINPQLEETEELEIYHVQHGTGNEEKVIWDRILGYKVKVIYREDSQLSGITLEEHIMMKFNELFELHADLKNKYKDITLAELTVNFTGSLEEKTYLVDEEKIGAIKCALKDKQQANIFDYKQDKELTLVADNILSYSFNR